MWVEVNLEKCTLRQLKEKIEDKIGVSGNIDVLMLARTCLMCITVCARLAGEESEGG